MLLKKSLVFLVLVIGFGFVFHLLLTGLRRSEMSNSANSAIANIGVNPESIQFSSEDCYEENRASCPVLIERFHFNSQAEADTFLEKVRAELLASGHSNKGKDLGTYYSEIFKGKHGRYQIQADTYHYPTDVLITVFDYS